MNNLKLIWIGLLTLFAVESSASHVLGGNITWQCLGGNQYQITFNMYRDCFGQSAPLSQETVFLIPSGCGVLPFSVNLSLTSTTEVSELCPIELANSSCNGGILPGAQQLVYSGTVTLDPGCAWEVTWNGGDWNYMNNINFSTFPDAVISSEINPAAGCLSSIQVTSAPIPYECRNIGQICNQLTVSGADGYTLTYAAVTPQTLADSSEPLGPTINVPGYAPISGLTVSAAGNVCFNSNGLFVGNYVATIQISIFQGAIPVGTIFHNMTFVIRDCVTTPTTFVPDGVSSLTGGTLVNATTIDVCVGDPLCFSVSASNTNPFRTVNITAAWPPALNAGAPAFTSGGTTNPRVGTFCMATTPAMIGGPYIIEFDATDDACVLPGFDQLSITINIYPALTLSVTDTMVCVGQSLPISASGGTTYTWTPLSGAPAGLTGNGANQTITNLQQDASIEVLLNGVPAQCASRDTVNVEVALSALSTVVTQETCVQNDGDIDLTVSGGSGNYTYSWSPGGASTQDLTDVADGNYCVEVTETSIPNCTATTCAAISNALPPGGTLSVQGGITTICQGGQATLVFSGTGDNTQPYVITVTGAGANVPASINHNGTFTVSPPVGTTTYTLTGVSYLNPPNCSTTVNSSVTITVRPLVTASFDPAGPFCSGSNAPLTVQLSQPGNFNVTYTAVPADPPAAPNPAGNPWTDNQVITFGPLAATTTYTVTNVEYTTAPLCPNPQNNVTLVNVTPLPTAALSGGTTICAGGNTNLSIALTGTGPWTVAYTINGAPAAPLNIGASPFVWNLAPLLNSTYCLTSVTDATGCSQSLVNQCQTIVVSPIPTANISGGTTGCAGTPVNLTVALTGAGPWNFTYTVNGGAPVAVNNVLASPYTLPVTVAGTYALASVELASGCAGTISGSTVVAFNPLPTAALSGGTAICAGGTAALSISLTGTGPWVCTTTIGGSAGPNLNIAASPFAWNVSPLSTSSYCIATVTDATGCTRTYTNTVCQTVTVNPLPTASIASSGSVCAGSSFNFAVSFTGTSPWTYTMTTPTGDQAVGPPAVTSPNNFAATVAGNYFVTSVTDANGCINTANSPTVTLTVNPLPTATIGGNGTICAGNTFNFPVNFTGASPWTYTMTTPAGNQVVGPPAVTSPNNFNASLAGNYFVTSVTDANGCTQTADSPTVTLTVNPLPTAALAGGAAICAGSSADLTVTLTGTGPWVCTTTIGGAAGANLNIATSPFVWTVTPGSTTAYCITSVTAANGCVQNYNNLCQTVTVNPLPTASISGNGVICAGASHNFPVSFTGSSPWTYTMTTPTGDQAVGPPAVTSPNNFAATVAGNYFVTSVTDANGCTNTANSPTVTLTVNTLPTATIGGNGAICAGGSYNFPVSFTGASPWSYTMTTPAGNQVVGPPAVTSPHNFAASQAGNYFVTTVTDANGCIQNADSPTVSLTVNPLPTANLSGGSAICAGSSANLTITLTGAGPWTVIPTAGGINQPAINVAASPFIWSVSPAATTTYCIASVTDANGCVQTYTNTICQTVTVNPLPSAAWSSSNSAYCDNNFVNVTFTLTGAAPWNMGYTISGAPNSINVINTSPHTLAASMPGNYCLTNITDANGCIASLNSCITISEVPVPAAAAGPDVSTCVNVPVQIGTPAIPGVVYSWNNAGLLNNNTLAQPSATIAAAGPTNFTLTASITASGISCTATDNVVVTVNSLPIITASVDDNTVCFGSTVTLSGAGAGAGGSYSWIGGTGITGPTNTAVTTALPVGAVTYEVQGTDINGCVNTANVNVTAADPITVGEDFTSYQCFGLCEGTISLQPDGGFGNYSISWGAAVPSPGGFDQSGLCAGTYPYTVSDSQGCNTTADNLQIVIDQLAENFIDDIIFTSPVCSYDPTGSIEIVEPGAMEYTLYNCPEFQYETQTNGLFTGLLPADCFDISVVDQFGCIINQNDIVLNSVSAPLEIQVNTFNTLFCFEDVIAFTGSGSGGFGNLVMEWHNCPSAIGCLEGTGTPFNVVLTENTTLYAVFVDENGCRSEVESVSAELSTPIELSVQNGLNEIELCSGQCVDLVAALSGGGPGLNVQWFEVPATINDPTIGPDGTVINVCPLSTAEFYAYASDGCNPPAYDTLLVTVYQTPVVLFSVDTLSGCFPVEVTFTNSTDTTLTDECLWNFGNGVTLPVCGEVTYTYPTTGDFFPSLQVTSPDGCVAIDTLDAAIEVYGYPEVGFIWEPLDINVLETTVNFINLTEGGSTYDWAFATFGTSTEVNPSFNFPDVDLAVYQVCLESTNEDGCTTEECQDIVIESILQVWVPSSFTPDQDGINEAFKPIIKGYNPGSYRLYIYNRWGTMVFQTSDPDQAWTGNLFDGEYYSQTESFVWRIELERLSDGLYEVFEGTVTLIR